MALFCSIGIMVIMLPSAFCGGGHGHGHGSGPGELGANGHRVEPKEWYLGEVTSDVGATVNTANITHIAKLLEKLNFVNCTGLNNVTCNLCFTAEQIMAWFGKLTNHTFSETELEEVLKGILFIILHKLPESDNCTSSITNFTANYNSSNVFKLFQDHKRYRLGTLQTNVSLEYILKDLKMSVGSKFPELPCYDEKDVMTGTNSTDVSTIGNVEFDWIVPYLMHETIDQRCIDLNKVHREPVNGHMRPADWYVGEVMGDVGSDGESFTKNHLAELLTKLNFKSCAANEESQLCNLCFNADDIWSWFPPANGTNIGKYKKEEFHNVLHGIIYLIIANTDDTMNCATRKQDIQRKNSSDIYQYFHNERWGVGRKPAIKSVQAILDDIKFAMKDKLTTTRCYNADDVLFGTFIYDGDIDRTDLEWVVAFLSHEVIDGRCIQPKKTIFIEDTLSHFGNGTHLTTDQFKTLVKDLSIGSTATTDDDEHNHGSDHGHDHKRKRRAVDKEILHKELHKCYSADDLLQIFDVLPGEFIDRAKLQELETALIQQIESKSCQTKTNTESKGKGYDEWQPWIATMLAVLCLTIGSCAGYLATPFQTRKWFPYLMIFMISLAVAVLTGDGIMHLLPHALGLHSHDADGGHLHGAQHTLGSDSYIWKSLLFLTGGYIFFTFEVFMRAFGSQHSHSHDLNINGVNNAAYDKSSEAGVRKHKLSTSNSMAPITERNQDMIISKRAIPIRSFKTVAWMILFGDALHNFMDGLAIGVAFTADWPAGKFGGISTSIAIFCHEVPHELGDFAVLLASGLSINQALVMNYISALTAFLGGIAGCAIGTNSNATPWIFALAGGLFVYMALTNMLPEAVNSSLLQKTPWLTIFILHFGMLLGYAIMFVLAAYEGDIHTSIE